MPASCLVGRMVRCCLTRQRFLILGFPLLLLLTTALPAEARQSLVCGSPISGEISAPAEEDVYTFFGEQGDTIMLTMQPVSAIDTGFSLVSRLFAPSGGPSGGLLSQPGRRTFVLPATGIYVLRVFDFGGVRRGTYALRLDWLWPLSKPCAERTPVRFGEGYHGSIQTPLEHDLYIISGVQGDQLTISLTQTVQYTSTFAVLAQFFRIDADGPELGLQHNLTRTTTLPGTGTYVVQVYASGHLGLGEYSVHVACTGVCPEPPTVPQAPTDLAVSVANLNVTLTWTPPASGSPPTSYVIVAGSAPGASDLVTVDTGSTAPAFSATAPPGVYYVRVRGRNAAGIGDASNEVTVVVGPAGPGCVAPPLAPSGLVGSAGPGSVVLDWNPATGTVTTYIVEAGSAPGANDLANVATGSSATSLSGPAPAGTYFVRVRAQNACGVSGPSNEITLVVP